MTRKRNALFTIESDKRPKVFLLGNGILKLGNNGLGWDDLLKRIRTRPGEINVKDAKVPYAMQPEALCGIDVEQIQLFIQTAGDCGSSIGIDNGKVKNTKCNSTNIQCGSK